MNKKKIGIPAYKIGDNIGTGGNHWKFLERFGNPISINPSEDRFDIDLLYLPGGPDLHPSNYDETPSLHSSNPDVFREHFFRTKLSKYIDKGIPVFGVCLGMQMIAAHFGCKLTQHFYNHEQSEDRWETAHKIYPELTEDGKVDKKSQGFSVNSHHHQGLVLNNINELIEPKYYAENEDHYITGDGPIVEAFKIKDKNIYGVQYHPEEMIGDIYSQEVILKLLYDGIRLSTRL